MASPNNDDQGQGREKETKRKKDCDTGQEIKSVDYDISWTQTYSDVSAVFKFKSKIERANEIDVQFEENLIKAVFPKGGSWSYRLFGEVRKEKSRVIVKGSRMELKMVKKIAQNWPTYQEVTPKKEEPYASAGPSDLQTGPEGHTGDEDKPIFYINHIKHDFFERDDKFVLHIYVKGTNKDAVNVVFEKSAFLVKFHTQDVKFLKLHEGTSEDTAFCWKVKLRKDIKPEMSTYKITGTYIELVLKKLSTERWGSLEAPQRKETESAKSDSWISTKKPTSTGNTGLAFDEMSDVNVDKCQASVSADNSDREERAAVSNTNENSKKPTCKVQPLNKLDGQQMVSPGYTGLDNLGNTCFMNSVLQALANTREFRDFFLDGRFQQEINQDNPLGTGGNLAVSFAVLLKSMWSGKKYSVAPGKLKDIVSKKASQFTGFAQHDAQEFMAFLLDGLHEDLNRVKKKPYTETVDSDGRLDEVELISDTWDVYKKRNDSAIVDLFQGQYKSTLVCPVCSKVSITFDPFLYLSVPLPKKCRQLPVIFMWKDPFGRKPVRYSVRLPKDARVEQLKDDLSKKTGVKPKDMCVFEAYRGKILKVFTRRASLSSVQFNDTIVVAEVLSEEVAGEAVYEIPVIQRTLMPNQAPLRCSHCRKPAAAGMKLKRCTKCFKVGYCDQACQRSHWQVHKSSCNVIPDPVGCPFIISIPESRATFSRLGKLMEAYSRYSVDVFQPPVQAVPPTKLSSHPSTSNLSSSSSSQSSGSLNSLDSQSSSASTHTLTADAEQALDDECDTGIDSSSTTALAGSATSLEEDPNVNPMPPTSDSFGNDEVPECPSLDQSASRNFTVGSSGQADEILSPDQTKGGSRSIPTNPVLGIQTEESERAMPLFHIKPVNNDGFGLKGPDGERLEDKGDVPLDLTSRRFLSMDWRNNDKLASYVLVQSKELDADDDESMQTAQSDDYSVITLDQCLDVFTEPEMLSPDEAWYCPRCKKHQEATKQMSIWRLPHLLIIQLKRFSFRNFIFRDKIDKMVEFPTRGLDLSKFILGKTPSVQQHPVYDLYGVINHHGGILGGHYTSYVRCTDTVDPLKNEVDWRLCDDSRVSSISNEKNVVTRAAYLLFYRKRTNEPILPPVSSESSEEEQTPQQSKLVTDSNVKVSAVATGITTKHSQNLLEKGSSDSDDAGETRGDNQDNRTTYRDLGYTDMDAVD
ncbi:LOW QUALITY PROTEIN: ubiquitin carboxyl-terminal hydrolase 19-like [Haliotis rubra]|uniref:LOW QUALITY PROTEIN: ubiquitin carboxyl-terminal hydrolase 19-like n=1 Tax=Haliotis rubra TaxID=36100 RepID=UPI001EE609EF|nr:LOW QUALITY PROTEIN: ubiquitin carboxyl-terminal hydrolase 19-like [Haliotis rubra]